MSRPSPPGGQPPPTDFQLSSGSQVDLEPLAGEICHRYYLEFGDEDDRSGPAGREWCRHDNLYLLAWSIADADTGYVDVQQQVAWLARVLEAREFPLARLVRNLELGAAVLDVAHTEALAPEDAEVFRRASALLLAGAELVRGGSHHEQLAHSQPQE